MNFNIPNSDQELQELWDDFLTGKLSPAHETWLREQLAQDAALRAKFEGHRTYREGIETHFLRKDMDAFHEAMPAREKPVKVRPLYTKFAIAATICVLMGLAAYFTVFRPSAKEQFYADNFVVDPGLPTTMSTTNNYEFFEGMVSYKRKEYDDAIARWTKLYEEEPSNDTLNYFIGVAHLAKDEASTAGEYLNTVEETANSVFRDEALFYLALSQIKTGQVKEAHKTLAKSKAPKNQELLKKLKDIE